MQLEAPADSGLYGPEPDSGPFLGLVSKKQTETAKLIEPGLEKPKALNIKVGRGNIQRPASVSGQKLVQDVTQTESLIVDDVRNPRAEVSFLGTS